MIVLNTIEELPNLYSPKRLPNKLELRMPQPYHLLKNFTPEDMSRTSPYMAPNTEEDGCLFGGSLSKL